MKEAKHSESKLRVLAFVFLLVAISGCSTFPELDERVSEQSRSEDYPLLRPENDLIAQANPSSEEDIASVGNDLAARVARLRARALWLQGQ